ncbi:hypothetical protein EYR40_008693 [Pleurotus pulmonarius]|nr:hypothetical protein EYR36_009512 [Pleurotus pulmonarius]KAF4593898.1 hypothetical protein EYR40_008693 [Pleurotus pulmonarius]
MGFHARQAAASDLRAASPSSATRSGWASVQSHQASWRGWKRMWLVLKEELHILDWESSESLEISLTSVSWLQALEYDGAQHCCLLVAGSLEYYISFWSERELFEWIDDISQWTSLNVAWQDSVTQVESPDVSASFLTSPDIGTTSLPSLQINDLPHREPQIVTSPEEDDGLEWREEILSEYFDAPKSPMSFTFISTPLKLVRKRACKRKGSEGRSQDRPMPSHHSNPSWTVNKHKLYQNLLSLLVLVTTVDSLRQDDRMLAVIRELFKSIEALDTVTTFLGQPGWLRDIPWETRKKDEADLVTLLRAISTSKSGFKAVLGLRGESAQQFLDMAHEILHFPSLQRSEDKRFGIQLLKVMIRLSEICHILPSSLFLAGVDVLGNDATYWGSFSNVYRASYLGQTVALKRMRVFETDTEAAQSKIRQKFCREALVWQHLKHPNVLPFIGIDPENFESLCIVSPWMENGTALSYLKLNGYNDVDLMLYGIGQGLAYLHSLEVVHGDLRGANILVDDEGNARIADFGLAVLTDMSTQTSSTYPGSVRWMAPELLYPASQGYEKFQRTRSSDVYSFACVCVELYTGLVPFSDIRYDATVALKVVAGERPGRPTWDDGPRKGRMPSALWTLVQSCWSQVCNQRPSVTTIIKYFKRDIVKGRC